MTIASQTTAETMLGDGVNRKFPFTFRAWASEVRVVVTAPDDTTEDVTGLASIVHNSAEEGLGGIVTYPAALEGAPVPAGWKLTVLRDMDFLQPVRLVNAARYDPVVIEQELDRLTAMIQQVREVTNRSAQLPVGTAYTAAEFLDIIYEARALCEAAMVEVAAVVGRVEGELDAKAAEAIATMQTALEDCLTQVQGIIAEVDGKVAEAITALETSLANCLTQLSDFAGRAETAASGAEDAEALAKKWATNPEDEPVTTDPAKFSAYHWAQKAQSATGVNDASETVKGIAFAATAAEVEAGETDPSRDGAATFVTPETIKNIPSGLPDINTAADGDVLTAVPGGGGELAPVWKAPTGGGGGGVPSGVICLWSGSVSSIDPAWALCDGTNGTPDLRDKFVVGAGLNYAPGASGGAKMHAHTGAAASSTIGGETGATTLTIAQMPSHTHTVKSNGTGNGISLATAQADGAKTTGATGGGGSHTHSLSNTSHSHNVTIDDADNLPPYYALAYIMKL